MATSFLKSQQSRNADVDRLFERGVSDVSRAPQVPLTETKIASAAAASKSGAGVWLLAHAKEIALCAASFAVGAGVTLLATHILNGRETAPQPAQSTVAFVTNDTTTIADDTATLPDTPVETYPGLSPATVNNTTPEKTQHIASLPSAQTAAPPVVITQTVTRRDTVRINETIILKDTIYVP